MKKTLKLSIAILFFLGITGLNAQSVIDVKTAKVTVKNEFCHFEITAPDSWSFAKIVQQDPYEEMKSGYYSSSISVDGDEKEPQNWNGFKLISTDTTNNPQPFLIIYEHKVADQKPEEFAKLFERTLSRFNGKELDANWNFSVGDAKGFDCTYGLIAKVRYTAMSFIYLQFLSIIGNL